MPRLLAIALLASLAVIATLPASPAQASPRHVIIMHSSGHRNIHQSHYISRGFGDRVLGR